jgi:hypothetical protein
MVCHVIDGDCVERLLVLVNPAVLAVIASSISDLLLERLVHDEVEDSRKASRAIDETTNAQHPNRRGKHRRSPDAITGPCVAEDGRPHPTSSILVVKLVQSFGVSLLSPKVLTTFIT